MNLLYYTDGSCSPNPGEGSWAFVQVNSDDKPLLLQTGYDVRTTNNRMELMAIIAALKSSNGAPSTIFSDSQLAVNTYNDWMHRWQAKGWVKRGCGGVILNLDLIMSMFELYSKNTKLVWVRSHSGILWNEHVDRACYKTLQTRQPFRAVFKTELP
jgi:ribonuclease HI